MRRRRGLLAGSLLIISLVFAVSRCTPELVNTAITPRAEFTAEDVPPAPNYTLDAAWLALPSTKDEADVALAELPAAKDPQVDVFYLHPTSSVEARWNAPADDDAIRTASIRGGTLIQASVFNGCCAVYAPTYRQASGVAFTQRSPSADRALDIAFADVRAAFEEFRARTGGKRPFMLTGHSQGAMLAARLLRERIAGSEEQKQMIAAYVIGAPLKEQELGGLPACTTPTEIGCVISFNARAPGHKKNVLDFGAIDDTQPKICVNPILGKTGAEAAPKTQHAGAVFFDSKTPAVLPAFADATCTNGQLNVKNLEPIPARGAPSRILLWVLGGKNYHPIEYQLFYVDLRKDAQRRAESFLSRDNTGSPAPDVHPSH